MTTPTPALLRTHTLHNGNHVHLHTDGSTLTATLVDGGAVEQRFEPLVLGVDRPWPFLKGETTWFWFQMVELAVRGGAR